MLVVTATSREADLAAALDCLLRGDRVATFPSRETL
jgi:hypothetical protein